MVGRVEGRRVKLLVKSKTLVKSLTLPRWRSLSARAHATIFAALPCRVAQPIYNLFTARLRPHPSERPGRRAVYCRGMRVGEGERGGGGFGPECCQRNGGGRKGEMCVRFVRGRGEMCVRFVRGWGEMCVRFVRGEMCVRFVRGRGGRGTCLVVIARADERRDRVLWRAARYRTVSGRGDDRRGGVERCTISWGESLFWGRTRPCRTLIDNTFKNESFLQLTRF